MGYVFISFLLKFFVFFKFIFGCAKSSSLLGFSLVVANWGYALVVVCRLLIVVASLAAEYRL